MDIIALGGISTKNTLVNTKGAVSLSINTSYIDGICLNVAYTIDNVFVIIDEETLYFTTEGYGYLRKSTYNDLLHYNAGNNVLKAQILSLKEALDVYNDVNKKLVLNLNYQGDRTKEYVENLVILLNNYNVNVYLKSSNKEILKELSKYSFKYGVVINNTNINEWNNEFDFYVINSSLITKEMILNKLNNKKEVMTQLIRYPENYLYYKNEYGFDVLDRISVITMNPSEIYRMIK